jgi:hypothetical protein
MQTTKQLLVSCFLVGLPFCALAQAPTEHYWYDGTQRRALYIDATQVADFNASVQGKSVLQPSGLLAKSAKTQSPVFKDAPGASGATRALPGGVIVVLPREMPEAQARQWLISEGLTPVRALGAQADTWLIDAPAGLPALELANRLFESGKVKTATPNWWQSRVRK